MKPWSFDAGYFNPNEEAGNYIFKNNVIQQYLDIRGHERDFFLVGSKGTGKTLLLRYKAFLYWKRDHYHDQPFDGSKSIPGANELVENMVLSLSTFSQDDINRLSKRKVWKRIWMFSISYYIIMGFQKTPDLPQNLLNRFKTDRKLAPIVNRLLTGSHTHLFSTLEYIPNLISQLSYLQSSFTLFIDRVDQGLDSFLSDEEYSYLNQGPDEENTAIKLWKNAQTGLLEAIYDINSINSHLKIFATCRTEALENMEGAMRQNILNYCTFLEYSKGELLEIFARNVSLMGQSKLMEPKAKDPVERFIGFREIPHPIVRNENGERRKEHVFDFIYRHTFGRPREIVRLGKVISDQLVCKSDYKDKDLPTKIRDLRNLVNDTAHFTLFTEYQEELIPNFRKIAFENFTKKVTKNVIVNGEKILFDEETINYLYRLGLIGYAHRSNQSDNQYQQRFLPIAHYSHGQNQTLPQADYYFTHPTIDRYLQKKTIYYQFYNRFNIIGNQLPFYKPPGHFELDLFAHEAGFYFPEETSGKSWTDPISHAGLKHPLASFFTNFFQRTNTRKITDYKIDFVENLTRLLNNFGFCYIFDHLNRHRGNFPEYKSFLDKVRQRLSLELPAGDLHSLEHPEQEDSLIHFGGRLQTRMLILAGLFFFNLDVLRLHNLIRNRALDGTPSRVQAESALKYLQDNFFIKALQAHPEACREEVYQKTSQFERKFLTSWMDYFFKQELFKNSNILVEHRDWLEKNVIRDIWHPDK